MSRASRLIIPTGKETAANARLVAIARAVGVEHRTLPIKDLTVEPGAAEACVALEPGVLRELRGADAAELLPAVIARFGHALVHGLREDSESRTLVRVLSGGALHGIGRPAQGGAYDIAADFDAERNALAGFSLGAARSGDRVLQADGAPSRVLVSTGGHPALLCQSSARCEVAFLAGGELADLDASIDDLRLEPRFSSLVLPALALRLLFGDRCWQPGDSWASLIIDDPALWPRYGALRFQRARQLLMEHRFHISIAFIPYNYRRSSNPVVSMFRESPDRFSLCYHGNDHTDGEFRSTDVAFLNSSLRIATARMAAHQALTGIPHDRVMVFPQGGFSSCALKALRGHNFIASINSGGYPQDAGNSLTLTDVIAPAVTAFGGFPVFFRQYVRDFTRAEIALHRFFGKPLLVAEHHQIFQDPEAVTRLVATIASAVPDVRWTRPRTAVENTCLFRRTADGALGVRVFANQAVIRNPSSVAERMLIERPEQSTHDLARVELDGVEQPWELSTDGHIRVGCTLGAGESRELRVVYYNHLGISSLHQTAGWRARVFARRRLSEFRDMWLSRNASLLETATGIRRWIRGRD